MERYKSIIRGNIFLAMGLTADTLDGYLPVNKFGKDVVDTYILKCATGLSNRYVKIFGLLYNCHKIIEVRNRLVEQGFSKMSEKSIQRYMSDSRREIIEQIIKSEKKLKNLKREVESAYEKDSS